VAKLGNDSYSLDQRAADTGIVGVNFGNGRPPWDRIAIEKDQVGGWSPSRKRHSGRVTGFLH
jgi:hypothetical protein